MEQIRFGLVGTGWRSLYYLRIAQALPERFRVTGVVVRDEDKGSQIQATWGVPTHRDLGRCVDANPSFMVTSVPSTVNPLIVRKLADLGMPVLSETPPAPDLDDLTSLYRDLGPDARVQVAEQYPFVPIHAARQSVIDVGTIGTVSSAQVSVAHGYHGVALLRKQLGVGFADVSITARRFSSPLVAGPDRGGPPTSERQIADTQTIATLDFGDKLGIFDFSGEQYFSWIRSPRVLIRGDRGEINDRTVRYLEDYHTPMTVELTRQDTGHDGNLEGYHHVGIMAGSDWVYKNPFAPGRLSDDEIAVATCLQKMGDYVAGGPSFYSLADASQDHYLSMAIEKAAVSGEIVRSERQAWAD